MLSEERGRRNGGTGRVVRSLALVFYRRAVLTTDPGSGLVDRPVRPSSPEDDPVYERVSLVFILTSQMCVPSLKTKYEILSLNPHNVLI